MANFFDSDMIDKLLASVSAYGISELEIEDGERKLKVKSSNVNIEHSQTTKKPQIAIVKEEKITGSYVNAPLSGIFYESPSPGNPPFVKVGQTIAKGDTLCIIEAMKMMNEVGTELSGIIKKILISNGEPVESGQPLFLISEE